MVTKADYEDDIKKKREKKDSWGKRFLKWVDKAAKKEPPKCGGSCCK